MDLDSVIARAAPPPERAGDGPFVPIRTDADVFARREAALHEAFESPEALAAHARGLGLAPEDWIARFGDVRLAGPDPDWAAAFREIFERLDDANREAPFREVFRWAVDTIRSAWPDGLPWRRTALDGPIGYLTQRLGSALMQTFQFEHRLGARGTTWAARFTRSPALAWALGRAMADWRSDLLRMLGHAAADRDLLSRRFFGGADPGALIGIESGLGDPHAGGRSVAILRFAHGSVVYKPKDLRIAAATGDIVGMLDSVELAPPSILTRAGYAWEREYAPQPLRDAGDADRFYRSLGGWLALLQTLNASDFWFDNLIADGATPRFVDFETVLQPPVAWPPHLRALVGAPTIGFHMRIGSVGILPLLTPTRYGSEPTDLGCVCRPGEHRTPLSLKNFTGGAGDALLTWSEDRYAPRYASGAFADAAAHFEAFEDGYRRATKEILESAPLQDRILRALDGVSDAQIRVIVLDTWSCYRLVQASLLPAHLANGAWREIALHNLLPRHAEWNSELREAAVRDLRRLDIPLFVTSPGSRDLRGVEGEMQPDRFPQDALSALRATFPAMAETSDRERIAWLRSAFSIRADNPPRRTPVPGAPAPALPEDLLAWAGDIGTGIRELAVRDPNGWPTWNGLQHDVHIGTLFLGPLGIDILSGRAGIAQALLELDKRLDRPDLADLAREALCGAAREYAAFPQATRRLGVGYVVGAGGLLDVLAREPSLRDEAERVHATAAEHEAWMESGTDFVSGLAGWRQALRAFGATPTNRHGQGRPYTPSARRRLQRWLDPENATPICPDRRAAARRRADRDREGNWFAERWADDRHDLSGIDGVPALAVAFARLAREPQDVVDSGAEATRPSPSPPRKAGAPPHVRQESH